MSQTQFQIRFGAFDVDLRAGQLRRSGARVHVQEQPFRVLVMLLQRPGEIVTREEIKQVLWPGDQYGDFDHAINVAVKKLRAALGDDADNPRFVETLPRRGYRFIAPVGEATVPTSAPIALVTDAPTLLRRNRNFLIVVAAALALAAAIGAVARWRLRRTPHEDIRSIAVLPLTNLSGDPQQEYFADGITDDLITDLAKTSGLRVISRTSVMRYKGAAVPLPQIAKELNVDAVVEGSVARAAGRIRITAQLIEASTDRLLWADSYEREARDVLQLQDDVTRAISRQVRAKLTKAAEAHLTPPRQVNPEAYELCLEGRYLGEKRTGKDLNDSVAHYRKSISLDPNYAVAYAGIAQSYAILGNNGLAPAEDTYPKAKAAALKALELDPNLGDAYVALAEVSYDYEWDWAAAEEHYKRAIEINPNDATAHQWYAMTLAWQGRTEEAIPEIEEAQRLDPLSTPINDNVGLVLYFARQYDRAIAQAQKTRILAPKDTGPPSLIGSSYLQKGMYPEAIAEFQQQAALGGGRHLFADMFMAQAYAAAGKKKQALDILKNVEKVDRPPVSPTIIAMTYSFLGERNEAFAWLEKAFAQRDPRLRVLKVHPAFDPLRSDPRFADLLRRRHLPTQPLPLAATGGLAGRILVPQR